MKIMDISQIRKSILTTSGNYTIALKHLEGIKFSCSIFCHAKDYMFYSPFDYRENETVYLVSEIEITLSELSALFNSRNVSKPMSMDFQKISVTAMPIADSLTEFNFELFADDGINVPIQRVRLSLSNEKLHFLAKQVYLKINSSLKQTAIN
jgi:hypothetical protein